MKKLQFIDIGKPFRIIGKICKDIERAFRFKGINVNFIVMMIDYIGFAFILKWNLQLHKNVQRMGPKSLDTCRSESFNSSLRFFIKVIRYLKICMQNRDE